VPRACLQLPHLSAIWTQISSRRKHVLDLVYKENDRRRRQSSVTAPCRFAYTYLLTPWSRVLLEKLTGSASSQEIPRFFGTRKFITVLTSARHLSLSLANSIQSSQPTPTSWRPILILSSHLRLCLPSGLFPSDLHICDKLSEAFAVTIFRILIILDCPKDEGGKRLRSVGTQMSGVASYTSFGSRNLEGCLGRSHALMRYFFFTLIWLFLIAVNPASSR